MSVGRKIEDEREAVRCLRAAERQGVSAGEWARAHGVDGRSMHAWQMNIARCGTTSREKTEERSVPRSGPERKRRMSEIIARIAERDREILAQLAR